jgi:hypothetical protein
VLTILDLYSEFAKLKMRGPVVTAREWRRDRTGRRRATTYIMTDDGPQSYTLRAEMVVIVP